MEKISDRQQDALDASTATFANSYTFGIGPEFCRISFFQMHTIGKPILVGSFLISHNQSQELAELIQNVLAGQKAGKPVK